MIVRILIALVVIAALVSIPFWSGEQEPTLQGWIEADMVFVSPDEAGKIKTLAVQEGDPIRAGAGLFELDDDLQRADLAVVDAAVENAQSAYNRASELLSTHAGTQAAYDTAQSALRSAEAQRNAALTRLARRRVASPVTGTVQEVYFRVGELVSAGKPVVSLLPPGNVKVRFFVPEATLPHLSLGDRIGFQCDGCASGLMAKISFISRTAEYTPPVIYSREERSKLVYLVEARPTSPQMLRVGQPVSVTLQPNSPPATTQP